MQRIYIDDSNLVVQDDNTGQVNYSVTSLLFRVFQDGDDVIIGDERNDYRLAYSDASDVEGGAFASASELVSHIQALAEDPINLGDRVRIGSTIISSVGDGLVIETLLGDSASSNYLGVIERTNSIGESELVVKRREVDA